jgi:hypothetical protein
MACRYLGQQSFDRTRTEGGRDHRSPFHRQREVPLARQQSHTGGGYSNPSTGNEGPSQQNQAEYKTMNGADQAYPTAYHNRNAGAERTLHASKDGVRDHQIVSSGTETCNHGHHFAFSRDLV